MDDVALLRRVLDGDSPATRRLVTSLMPVVQARVARVLVRRRGTTGRDIRQDVGDLVQDVFATLFADGARVLRAWNADRGLSLASFVGLVAEREAASILRSGKRSPWRDTATELADLDVGVVIDAEVPHATRETLTLLAERLREELSPRGLELFQRLVVDEEPIADLMKSMGMSADALYAWKSRLGKLTRRLAREIAGEEVQAAPQQEEDENA